MFTKLPGWNDHIPAIVSANAAAAAAAAAMDMDNSLGGVFAASTPSPSADASHADAGDEQTPIIYSTFEAEFWRSFADDHQLFESPQPYDATESGLWNGRFVPPPPRPPFMADESVMPDGLTTCDLCSWAVHEKNAFSMEGSFAAAGELGWAFSIGLVSVVSALIGAIIMITLVRCRRLKSNSNNHMNNHHRHHHGGHHLHHDHLDHHHHHHHHQHERGLHIGAGSAAAAAAHLVNVGGYAGGHNMGNGGGGGGGANISIGVDGVGGGGGGSVNGGGGGGAHLLPWWCRKASDPHDNEHHTMQPHKQRPAEDLPASANPQVWIWLKTVNTPPTPEPIPMFPPSASIENYYTNTDDGCMGSGSCKVTEVVYEEIAGIG